MNRDDLVGYAVPAFTLGWGFSSGRAWCGTSPSRPISCRRRASSSPRCSPIGRRCRASLWVTLSITLKALARGGRRQRGLAVIFAQSRLVERAFYPFAVAMQVTPIVAIAPLLLIYLTPSRRGAGLRFPGRVLSAARQHHAGPVVGGPQSRRSLQMYRATRFQQFMLLRLPSALPYFLAGLRISGGLALIGAIVAEIAAGSAGQGSGLPTASSNSGFRLNIPRMFAALLLISVAGITIHVLLTAFSHWLLPEWHDSERGRET